MRSSGKSIRKMISFRRSIFLRKRYLTVGLIGDGTEIYGEVHNSIIGWRRLEIEEGAVVRDSIVMQNAVIHAGAVIDKAIIAEQAEIGEHAQLGVGGEVPNKVKPAIYSFGLTVIGEKAVVPPDVKIGKNTAVTGVTVPEDYPDGLLAGGEILDKAGDVE